MTRARFWSCWEQPIRDEYCRAIAVTKGPTRFVLLEFFIAALLISLPLLAQRERQVISPSQDGDRYGQGFFGQLSAVFGRFSDSDLQRVFESARPIECSELINQKGEWHPVAFFNEKRNLGSWYHKSLEQVRHDLSAYLFSGTCRGEHGDVQLTTKYAVVETLDAYQHGTINWDNVEVNVNAPVTSFFDSRSQAYVFDLPYLFFVRQEGLNSLYSLAPPSLTDTYSTSVLDHWECKAVKDDEVTYRFLICRSTMLYRDPQLRETALGFGAAAYWILSDGREATSTVRLTYNDRNNVTHTVKDADVVNRLKPAKPVDWEVPDLSEKIADLVNDELRVEFSNAWKDKINSAQFVSQQHLTSLESSDATPGVDYCTWLPKAPLSNLLANSDDDFIRYSLIAEKQDLQASITLDVINREGSKLASLKCVFANESSLANVGFGRWRSIVGDLLKLRARR